MGASFDSVAYDHTLPSFGGAVNLALDNIDELTSGHAHLSSDLTALAGDHVTSIDLSHLSVDDLTAHTADLQTLDSALNTVDTALAGTGEHLSLNISDLQGHGLAEHSFSFTDGSNVVLDGAHSTHLSTSLKELEQLKIGAVTVGAGGINVDIGSYGTLDGVTISGLPDFTGGHAHLSLNSVDQLLNSDLHVAKLTTDISALAHHGFDQINLDSFDIQSLEGFLSTNGQDGLSEFNDLLTAVNTFDASPGAHSTVTLSVSDAAVHALVNDGFTFNTFASTDHIAVGSHGTHLSSSLQDLSSMHINHVNVAGGIVNGAGLEHISIDLGATNIDQNVMNTLASSLPAFTLDGSESARGANTLDVTLDINAAQAGQLLSLEADHPTISDDLFNALHAAGITSIAAIDQHVSLEQANWLHLDLAGQLHTAGITYQEGVVGSSEANAPVNFNEVIGQELTAIEATGHLSHTQSVLAGLDLLAKYTSPDKFGDLLHALTASGVSDFVVENGNVQIGDTLAAALVDAGMLQALPSANLVIDATGQMNQLGADYYGHLATNLKAIADLGVDAIETGNIKSLYVDLGLPVHDTHAMADISQLLHSLDPANQATELAHGPDGSAVGISLVINGEVAAAIKEAGGFTTSDIQHMDHLGINHIAVVDNTTGADTSGLINSKVIPSDTVVVPEVKIIGSGDPMYDELYNPNLPHPK